MLPGPHPQTEAATGSCHTPPTEPASPSQSLSGCLIRREVDTLLYSLLLQVSDSFTEVEPMPNQKIRVAQVVFIVALSAKWDCIKV